MVDGDYLYSGEGNWYALALTQKYGLFLQPRFPWIASDFCHSLSHKAAMKSTFTWSS